MIVRAISWFLSLAMHVVFASYFLVSIGNASLESGTGADTFTVEQGIAIEGIAKFGEADLTTEVIEAEPVEVSEARPEIKEVKAEEKVEETELVTSAEGPQQEEMPEVKPEQLEQPRPPQVATIEQTDRVEKQLQSSGEEQQAGSATEKSKYLGKLRYHIEGKKVNPRSQQVGTVLVQFTVDAAGNVVSRQVTSSSGSKILDDAALASIDRAAPFPPMPDTLGQNNMVVSVPFKFTVR
jgi:TonB family C-terminal domain